jgi:hypothetical protein
MRRAGGCRLKERAWRPISRVVDSVICDSEDTFTGTPPALTATGTVEAPEADGLELDGLELDGLEVDGLEAAVLAPSGVDQRARERRRGRRRQRHDRHLVDALTRRQRLAWPA